MANRRECYLATLESVTLKSSNFILEKISPQADNRVRINLTVSLKLLEEDSDEILPKGSEFVLSVTGEVSATSVEDDESVFTGNSEMLAIFIVKSEDGLDSKKIKESAGFYGLQVYPLLREHFSYNLSKMRVASQALPWDVKLGNIDPDILNHAS